ncbi:MAG: hypothetical protein ACK5LS_12935 [Propioniciclava sp.]
MLVLTSASGAPGVTTTALGLVLQWPDEAVLMDADRSASHAVLAGYLQGRSPQGLGMQGLIHAHRERRDLRHAFEENRLLLPPPPLPPTSEAPPPHWFVPGFTHLQAVDHFENVWTPLQEPLREHPGDVIVDAGRIGHRGLPEALLGAATSVALVCRTSLVSLAALRLYIPPLVEAAPPGQVGLVLVGPGRPYRSREVTEQFRLPVWAEIPWEPRQAADLSDGADLAANWSRQALARGYARAAQNLREAIRAGLDHRA